MPAGANGPQPQDDYAFSYQFDGMCGAGEWNPVPPPPKIQRLFLETVLLLFAAHYKAPRAAAIGPLEISHCNSNNTLTTISDHFYSPPSLENEHNTGQRLTDGSIEVDRAHENLQKSGKGYMMNARREFPVPYCY
jgi:hypothetical protein